MCVLTGTAAGRGAVWWCVRATPVNHLEGSGTREPNIVAK